MQTIKTAVVVVLLLFVLYGGYVAMNGTDTPLKAGLNDLIGADQTMPDVSGPSPIGPALEGNALNGFEMFNSTPAKPFGSSSTDTNGSTFANANAFGTPVSTSNFPASPSNLPASPSNFPASPSNFPASPSGFPASPSTALQSAPLLAPSTNALPSLPSNPPSTLPATNASQPGLSSAFPSSSNDLSIPSTSIPAFNPGLADTKNPDFSPSIAESAIKPLDLPSESAEGTGFNAIGTDASPPSLKTSVGKSYENAKELAMKQIERRNLKDALATLSFFYNAPELTTEQRLDLLDLLDALSREVVFSRSHLMDMAYIVAPSETLETVAKRYELPTEILARINAIDTTTPLRGGEKLKVIPGPFRAEVNLSKNELTLFLGDLYAGRYPVTFGSEPPPQPGVFEVLGKQKNKSYYGNGVQIPANDPRNPFGGYWIDLGQDLCIHGSPNSGPADSKLGCISLAALDANDVFGMLGYGSNVTIRR